MTTKVNKLESRAKDEDTIIQAVVSYDGDTVSSWSVHDLGNMLVLRENKYEEGNHYKH